MTLEKEKKKKILALITVVFLFSIVGSLFFIISIKNKEKTIILKKEVRELQIKQKNILMLEKLHFDKIILPELTSKSFLTLAITNKGTQKILSEKNPNLILPIASITKLMVAVIILENTNLETEVTASLDYIGKEESAFILEINKTYKIQDLLANALISSDNDSARLLSSVFGENKFIEKMNLKSAELGLTNTSFTNVTGLDPTDNLTKPNLSTVTDLANLLIYIKEKHPEILKITTQAEYNFCDINNYCKPVINTNKLLKDNSIKYKIIGGKTGSTDLAGKNLAFITEPINSLSVINIVLGSNDNFMDTLSLINNIVINN